MDTYSRFINKEFYLGEFDDRRINYKTHNGSPFDNLEDNSAYSNSRIVSWFDSWDISSNNANTRDDFEFYTKNNLNIFSDVYTWSMDAHYSCRIY